MDAFANKEAVGVTLAMVDVIAANRQRLSDIDGLIGDGDHGVNMDKGFQQFRARLDPAAHSFTTALRLLANELLEIGGSMGPLYSAIFRSMARVGGDAPRIDAGRFGAMLAAAEESVRQVGECAPGEKTLLDVLAPARVAFAASLAGGADFRSALAALSHAAESGREATTVMRATKGRASRLGDRSRGVPDPGATSCALLLVTMATELARRMPAARG